MPGTKREPPILNLPRGNESLRDLEDPTHAFPIGAMSRPAPTSQRGEGQRGEGQRGEAQQRGGQQRGGQQRRGQADDMLDLSEAPITADDDDYDFPELPAQRGPMIDARWVVLWLVAATILAVLAGLAAAVAVVYL